ncbi:helix-turn-helix domain-containing protein [Romboutsia ilealis]|uniref:helix-turn-helix domain-containing protein n=1 Tax=Romboutsia ilealis TaxID=1115758 RepID=UPI0026F3C3FF|nr:helix-turn-helix domain-containing protein [Romboutsia ilealis]
MYDKFLSIIFNKEYDVTNKKYSPDVYLKVDVKALQSGLLKKVNGSDLTVLMAIASCMNINGTCYPTQRQLADITGMSLTTINRAIKSLLEITVNGHPVLERRLLGSGSKKSSVYTIFDIAPVEDEMEVDADVVTQETNPSETSLEKPKTAKDFAHYFAEKYKDCYGQSYVINYKRDLALIKNKLMSNFDNEMIIKIIDVTIEEYREHWSNPKYPYPSISMMCSWISNKAVELILKETEQDAETEELIEMAETSNNNFDFDSL